MSPEANNVLHAVINAVDKKYGKGSLIRLTDKPRRDISKIIRTGSLTLDTALGIGGYPTGRIIEVYGQESTGKSTLALHAIANAQIAGKMCGFIDAEHALDPAYAEALGVDFDNLLFSQPDCGEHALDIADMLAKSGQIGLIVVDSVAALVPQKELEGDFGDSVMGLQARLMSQAMRKLAGTLSTTDCTIIFINQIRSKIGVIYGSPEVTTGGNALKFYASQRIDLRRISQMKDGTKIIGQRVRAKVVKNKLAPPFREAEFDIKFGAGVDRTNEIVDLAIEDGIVTQAGSWFSIGEEKIGQGKAAVLDYILSNKEEALKIEKEILSNRGLEDE